MNNDDLKNKKFEALNTANEYLFSLKAGIVEAVNFFEKGEYGKGCDLVTLIADGIDYISEVIILTNDILEKREEQEKLNDFLKEIVEAIENEDFILVGDLFNYEVLPILEDIHSKIISKVAN